MRAILEVDDDPQVPEVVGAVLRLEGHYVATTGELTSLFGNLSSGAES